MSAIEALTEEECYPCARCGDRPRLAGLRSTWCRACKSEWQRSYRAGVRRQWRVPSPLPGEGGCLIWQGAIASNGYGRMTFDGKSVYAHRHALEVALGRSIAEGLVVDHLCGIRSCVNAEHLEEVTLAENTRRGQAGRRLGYCAKHELEMDRRTPQGRRYCSLCMHDSNARKKKRRLATR